MVFTFEGLMPDGFTSKMMCAFEQFCLIFITVNNDSKYIGHGVLPTLAHYSRTFFIGQDNMTTGN